MCARDRIPVDFMLGHLLSDSPSMHEDSLIFSIFLIFTGAAIFAALALFARQSLLVAYIALGGVVGPAGFGLVKDPSLIQQIGHIGIIFLLFLLGLNLQPNQLMRMLREAVVVTAASSRASSLARS
jgi:Kef-type K+ transport system membrane component KefB